MLAHQCLNVPQALRAELEIFEVNCEAILNDYSRHLEAKTPPAHIFHYTNAAGLHGILGTGTVWFTDVFKLNDPSEVVHGVARCGDVLKRLCAKGHAAEIAFADLFRAFCKPTGVQAVARFYVWGGEWTESGPLRRRHVHVAAVQHIGKEADRWEEQTYVGAEEDDRAIEYGLTAETRAGLLELIRAARVKFKLKRLAKAARVSDNTITALLAVGALPRDRVLTRVAEAVDRLENDAAAKDARVTRLLDWTRMRVHLNGMLAVAMQLR